MLLLLPGLWDATEARLLGRLLGSRDTPKDKRLTPGSPVLIAELVEACDVRLLLLLTVTVLGMWCPIALAFRGLARGGVCVGAGSLDLTLCTRSSSFCMLPIRFRIWYSEPDLGRTLPAFPPTLGRALLCAGTVVRIDGVARPLGVAAGFIELEMLGPRECRGGLEEYMPGRGVAEGSSAMEVFRFGIGVEGIGLAGMEASDRGGEGGVVSGGIESAFERGGVEAVVGEDSVVADVDVSETGERGRRESPASRLDVLRWWWFSMVSSAIRNFSCTISASMRKSDNSSRSLCVSILNPSRSCSPILISSSSMTVRSKVTLYFDSRSSSDDVWLRPWRSRSSF